MYKVLAFFMIGLMLTACGNTKKNLGLIPSSPDEFKVVQRAPLEMPDSYELPPPRPGAPRPQDASVPDLVKTALTGQKSQKTTAIIPSRAEEALLQKTDALHASDEIRSEIDQETRNMSVRDKSVARRLLGIGGLNRKDGVLDAEKEAQRLEQEKLTPMNE